ncbi:MAG: F0F1 ATP synthase subunit B [Rhodothermales bacterium]|nr:F0F1 ATP synthase subunit B [Rhodothermales bacterium]
MLAANLLAPNAGLIFWTAIIFTLLLFLLSKFAWGPVTKALAEREQTIDASIRRAELALAEAKQLQADNDAARRAAEADARKLLADANEAADRARTQRVDELNAELAQRREQAEADLERQKTSLREELRSEVATLAVQAAEKVLRANLDGDANRRLVDDFINTLPSKN